MANFRRAVTLKKSGRQEDVWTNRTFHWRLCLFVVCGIGSCFHSFKVEAQASDPSTNTAGSNFSYADLFRLRSVENVTIDSSGRRIAYTLSAIDQQKDRTMSSTWTFRVADKQTLQVKVPHASAPSWSPDGRTLAVTSQTDNGSNAIVLLQADDLKVVQSFSVTSTPENLVWSPDGQKLAFSLFRPDNVASSFLQKAIDTAREELGTASNAYWAKEVEITEAARYRQDGGIWLKAGHEHLFVLSIADGKLRQLETETFDATDPAWMPDSRTLLYRSDRRPDRDHRNRKLAIYKTDLLTGGVVQLTDVNGNVGPPVASPDGKWIAFTGFRDRPANYTHSDLYLIRPDGTEEHRIATQLDRDVYSPLWAADSRRLYAKYDNHGIFRVGLFGLDGKVTELVSGVDSAWSVSGEGDIAYAGNTAVEPNEVRLQCVGAASVVLTSSNDFLRQRKLGHLIHVETKSSADGVPVEGWALLPAGASEHTRQPTILAIHGGPFGSDGPNWSRKFQLYASAGYAVVYANYRGSTSYGTSFSEPANHDFPEVAYGDLIDVLDESIRHGFADPNRLFVTGGSAGGELTAWITGKDEAIQGCCRGKTCDR